ncbi:DUF2938 domain-containing protein [Pseudovibrio sp. Ad37]|uniref:DUF2938 domain-containing protein n=1 Tax=Pseudovibrio sp. Ad37 TaxID=989422 RepID=UPI0007AE557D|nr:DUF2938 domain-containing protein [Pseudovibrio sp. Ad37]KZL13795.1 hypothetical protein PsAD37_05187 [Pseudovibrio sp. Ad37]
MHTTSLLINAILLGIGATIFMDLVAWVRLRFFAIPSLDYRLVGRWLLSMLRGQFQHQNIMQSSPQPFERSTGWIAHYVIGAVFAFFLLAVTGPTWLQNPTILMPLIIGLLSVGFPFFFMQPAFGFGIAASKTPAPTIARTRSLIAHLSFGVGLYLTGLCLSLQRIAEKWGPVFG